MLIDDRSVGASASILTVFRMSRRSASSDHDLESLKAHVLAFVTAYNFAQHLNALRWRTPYQMICDALAKDPSVFKINPHLLTPGPNT